MYNEHCAWYMCKAVFFKMEYAEPLDADKAGGLKRTDLAAQVISAQEKQQ